MAINSILRTNVLSLMTLLGALTTVTHAASQYSMTNLGDLGAGQSIAFALNDEGQVVGYATLANGETSAFVWQESTGIVNLGTLSGDISSYARSINNSGQITGESEGADGVDHGFIWQPNSGMVNISSDNSQSLYPFAINQQGQIYGQNNLGGFIYTAQSGMTQAIVPGAVVGAVYALNSAGQMVFPNHAADDEGLLFYSPGKPVVQIQSNATPQYTSVMFSGMNEQGTVVGELPGDDQANYHAYLWNQDAGMTDLTPGYNNSSWAAGINNLGEIVGGASINGGPGFAFLYDEGTLYNLTTLLDASSAGWSNLVPKAINDNGQITGFGLFDGQQEAFLLTPTGSNPNIATPEPASVSLLLLGTALLLRRNRRAGRI